MKRSVPLLFLALLLGLSSCNDYGTQPGEEGAQYNHQRNPGSSAEDLLRNDPYSYLEVEIDYMPDYAPDPEALDSLEAFLERRLQKTNVSILLPTEIPSGDQSTYSAEDVRNIEQEYRTHFSTDTGDTLRTYMLIVDGEYSDSNVLAIAYYNTSTAYFGATVEDVSTGFLAPPRTMVEGTVYRHEFSHIMGLVGNGTPLQTAHQTDGSAHCTTDGCLMEPEVETTNYFENLRGGDIRELDELCLEDLRANGGS